MAIRRQFSLLPLTLLFALGSSLPAQEPPNIIFVMADDLGYGDLGCYGQKQIQTPNIDRMAADGVRFTDFYAGSTVCAPSRCVLMTGLHTGHCFIRGNAKLNLRPGDVTVAEVLKKAGYACGQFGKWGLGHEGSAGIPTEQGFDEFFGYFDQGHAHNYYPTYLMHNADRYPLKNVVPDEGSVGNGVATEKVEYSHDLIMQRALDWLDAHADQRFFLYLPVTVPHANNEAKQKGMEVPDYGPYANKDWPEPQKGTAAMITRLDSDMGHLFASLKAHGIDDKTIVFFTSDNGPHAEGGNDADFFDSNGPLRGIKRALYEGGIRVPMIVRWPGHTQPGTDCNQVAYHGDLMATAAELANVTPPRELDSISLVPAILGRHDGHQHDRLYWEFYEQSGRRAVRKGNWKAVQNHWNPQTPEKNGPVEIYDLSVDLGEDNDLAESEPQRVRELQALMDEAHIPSSHWQVK